MAVLEHVHEGLLERLLEEVSLLSSDVFGLEAPSANTGLIRREVFFKFATGIYEFCEREGLTVEEVARTVEAGTGFFNTCRQILDLLRMDVSTNLSSSIEDKFKQSKALHDGGHTHGFKNFQD